MCAMDCGLGYVSYELWAVRCELSSVMCESVRVTPNSLRWGQYKI